MNLPVDDAVEDHCFTTYPQEPNGAQKIGVIANLPSLIWVFFID